MSNIEIINVYPGNRRDVRIVKIGIYFRIQYQFSRTKDQWRNYIGSDFRKGSLAEDCGGYFRDAHDAIPYAKRKLAAKN